MPFAPWFRQAKQMRTEFIQLDEILPVQYMGQDNGSYVFQMPTDPDWLPFIFCVVPDGYELDVELDKPLMEVKFHKMPTIDIWSMIIGPCLYAHGPEDFEIISKSAR